jgi:citrate lyase beta subunit
VPGAEPRKLERAREAGADVLILDLEDSVAPEQKTEARQRVAEALVSDLGSAKLAVRINAPGTPYFEADLEGVTGAGGKLIVLPKCESAGQVADVAESVEKLERKRGVGSEEGAKLVALVESPAGVLNAASIAAAAAKVEALAFGHADFSLEMGLGEADASCGVIYHARCTLVIAAKAAGVAPIDCVHLAVRDEEAYRADAELGLRLGFEGKLCIHPKQVEIANEIYTPTSEQVDYALRVVEAWEAAQAEGRGVFALEGKMVDAPLVAVQRRILQRARRAGVLKS